MEYLTYLLTPVFTEYFLLCVVGVVVVVTLLLFIVLIVHKIHVESQAQTLRMLKDRYTSSIKKSARINKPARPIEFVALCEVVIDMMFKVNVTMVEQLRTIARGYGIVDYYRKSLGSRSWVKRYRAVEKLGFLKLPECKPFYHSILEREKDLHVISKTIWALSLISGEEDLPVINKFMVDPLFASSKYKAYIYTNIISAFRERGEEGVFLKFLSGFMEDETLSVLLKKDMIEACGDGGLHSAKETIITCFRRFHDIPEMRISCIRALERICAGDAHSLITEGLGDTDWRVRAVAAKDAYICPPDIIEPLEKALYDQNYHVRINAAQALKQMGEKGRAVLNRNTKSNDRFVRDVTNYVLAEKNYA